MEEKEIKEEHWDKIISSKKKLFDLHLRSVWDYKYLILMFIRRDFTVQYKQTILGPIWYLVQPIISSIMYSFVFGTMAGVGTDGIPMLLFYYAGTMLWTYFTGCLNGCASIFTANQGIFGKVYFPRLTAPVAKCGFEAIRLFIQFVLLCVFILFYVFVKKTQINISLLCLTAPLIFLWVGLIGGSLGLIISSLTTKYRDLNILLAFGLQLAMYATPVVYPLSQIPGMFRSLVYFNPMCAPVEFFRMAFYGAGSISTEMMAVSLGETVVFLILGLILFTRNERNFVDVI